MKYLSVLAAAAAVAAQSCDVPTKYSWTSSGSLATPANGWQSLKDFTITKIDGKWLVYASYTKGGSYSSMAFEPVSELSQLSTAKQNGMPFAAVAPELIYFAPKSTWVLSYQWGPTAFSYRTSTNPANVNGWGNVQTLSTAKITGSGTGVIDQTLCADNSSIYLFFAGDNGKIYRQSMPLGNFPGSFGDKYDTIMSGSTNDLFEAVECYTVKGMNKYVLMIESIGSQGRYFRTYTATSLNGTWTANAISESNPFAGKNNAGASWTNDISHGDLLRENPDQTKTVDFCPSKLQLFYQGKAPGSGGDYNSLPWRPGVLTLK